MSALLGAAGAVVGIGVGAASGWLAVHLEEVEGLEAEEAEERDAFLAQQAEEAAAASAAGEPAPRAALWESEHYGWTWLERVASPALGAVGFGAFVAHDGLGGQLAIHLVWVAVLLHISLFDAKHRLILDRVTYPAIVVALGLSTVTDGLGLRNAIFGGVVAFLFFAIPSLALGSRVLGFGDAKLGALVGATTGLGTDLDHLGVIDALIAAILSAGVAAVLLLIVRVRGLRDPIPYGPFLCAGAALIIYHGAAGP